MSETVLPSLAEFIAITPVFAPGFMRLGVGGYQ